MILMLVEYLHSGRQLLVRGEGIGGPFLGRNEGLRAPFFRDGPPTSTSFLGMGREQPCIGRSQGD